MGFWLRGLLLYWLALVGATAAAQLSEPSTASLLYADSLVPPPASAPWQRVTLPLAAGRGDPDGKPIAAWVRIEFDARPGPRPEAFWAVYVPYMYDGGRFFLNDVLIANVAEPSPTTHVKWERPHLLPIPRDLLKPADNVLAVRTRPAQALATLKFPRISVGDSIELQRLNDARLFWVRSIPQITTACCLLLAAFGLFIWMRQPAELLYGLFGIAALCWGIRTQTFVIESLPVEHWWQWRLVYHAATGGFMASIVIFLARFARLYRPWMSWVLLAYISVGPLVQLASRGGADGWVSQDWSAGFVIVGIAMVAITCYAAWQQRSRTSFALLAGILLSVLLTTHDYLVLVNAQWLARLFPDWIGSRIYIAHHGANAMLMIMTGILGARFVQTLLELEELNRDLETRVSEREAVIRANHDQITLLARDRAAMEERQQIMQDMHDGLGSQLLVSLSRAERGDLTQGEMSGTLRTCITDMRLAINALSPIDSDFAVTFADFRFRWETELKASGILSRWQMDATPEPLSFPPHVTLQVLRIVQEAITNAYKHAHAKLVQVRLIRQGAQLRVEVEDDGVGLPERHSASGRGLRNMRARAQRLGADFDLSSRPGRTLVSLRLDLQPSTGAAA